LIYRLHDLLITSLSCLLLLFNMPNDECLLRYGTLNEYWKPFRPFCLSSNCHHYGLLLHLLLLVVVASSSTLLLLIIIIHSDSGSRWWRLCRVCTALLDVEGLLGMLKKYQSNNIWGLNCYLVGWFFCSLLHSYFHL